MATWTTASGTPTLAGSGEGACYSPDGSMLAVGSASFPRVYVYTTSGWTDQGLAPIQGIGYDVAWMPDSSLMAVGHRSFPYLTIYDTSTWNKLTGLTYPSNDIFGVDFSPDGAYLAVAFGGSTSGILVQDTATWSEVTLPSVSAWCNDAKFSPDGAYLAIASTASPYLHIIDTSDWTEVTTSFTLTSTVYACAFSPDSSLLAIASDSSPYFNVIDTATWIVVSGTPTLGSRGQGVSFDPLGEYVGVGTHSSSPNFRVFKVSDWSEETVPSISGSTNKLRFDQSGGITVAVPHDGSPYLTIVEAVPDPEMVFTLEDTSVAMTAEVDPAGDMIIELEDTNVAIEGDFVGGELITTLGATTVSMGATHEADSRHVELIGELGTTSELSWVGVFSLAANAASPVETYYNPQQELTESGKAALQQVIAYIQSVTLESNAAGTVEAQVAAAQWLNAQAQGSVDLALQLYFEDTLAALAGSPVVDAFAVQPQDTGNATGTLTNKLSMPVTETMAAELLQETTLTISVTDTLEAEADDSVQALGTYFANVKDMAGAWVVFKVSGEVVQGWVMNLEGERPFSEYRGFEFNSMAKIGDRYFGASDDGLYALTGDTDDGEQIDARLSSMMLDFDTTAQKRVVAAYLGYTSDGTVVLKVRSVDDGKLVEHWYEAAEVTADAPRTGYRPLGRGLKSRYWQFELANVDGSDFEIDKLELQPIKLSRRV